MVKLKFNVERSREIRQWVSLLLSTSSTLALVDIYANDAKVLKKIVGKVEKVGDKIDNKLHKTNLHNNEPKVYSREELKTNAEKDGFKSLHYSNIKWDEVKSRFCLLQKTINDDGFYYASFNDTTYYIMID